MKVRRRYEKLKRTLQVVNPLGIHLRVAGEIVKLTSKFKADVTLQHKREKVSGKSLMSIMSLAMPRGTFFTATASGEDAEELLRALAALAESGFGEGRGEEGK